MTDPPGLMGSRVLALVFGIRGEAMLRAPLGARPKLRGDSGRGEGKGRRWKRER